MTKTASESLHLFFNSISESNNPYHRGKKGKKMYRHHGRFSPIKCNKYSKIVSIRNPYDRIASIYAMSKRQKQEQRNMRLPVRGLNDLLDFLLYRLKVDTAQDNNDYQHRWLPIHKFIEPITNVKHLLRFEHLEKDISNLPFIKNKFTLPHRNFYISYPSFEKIATIEILEKANIWAGEDFKLFNYKKYNSMGDINEIFIS